MTDHDDLRVGQPHSAPRAGPAPPVPWTGLVPRGRVQVPPPRPQRDVFVSYSASNKPVADAIVARLEQSGIRCWVAPRDILAGTVYAEAIVEAITTCRLMVVVLSHEANESRHVHREVERAVANNKPVVPYRIDRVEPSGAMAYFLASENWLDAMTPPLEAHIAELVQVVSALLNRPGPQSQPGGHPAAPGRPGPPPRARQLSGGWLVPAALAVAAVGVMAVVIVVVAARHHDVAAPSPSPTTSTTTSTSPPPPTPTTHDVALVKLATGDCLQTPPQYEGTTAGRIRFWTDPSIDIPNAMPVTSCTTAHTGEVIFAGNAWMPSDTYPGDAALAAEEKNTCRTAFEQYDGVPFDRSSLGYIRVGPDKARWSTGDRRLLCVAYDPHGVNGTTSFRGSQR